MSVPSQHPSPVPLARANSAADSAPRTSSEQGESFDQLLTWAYAAAGERLHRVWERLCALPASAVGATDLWSVPSVGLHCVCRGRSAAATRSVG